MKFLSSPSRTRVRLIRLAATFVAVAIGFATPANAVVTAVNVGAQTGTPTYGTAGTATYEVTLTRTGGDPPAPAMSVTGLPTGAVGLFGTPSSWVPVDVTTDTQTIPLSITTSALTPANSGDPSTFTVTADSLNGDGLLTINRLAQTITFGVLADKYIGDPDFTVSASASSGLAVSYSAVGNCTVSGDTVHITGVGSCSITASQAGDVNFSAAANVTQLFNILLRVPVITFAPAPSVVYPGPDFTVHATTNSDGALTYSKVSGFCDLVDASYGTFSPTGVGTCVVAAATAATATFAAGSAQQSVAITVRHLYAIPGTVTPVAGAPSFPVWGYNTTNAAVTHPGGPPLVVHQGDSVDIVLHNQLVGEYTGLLLQGQVMIPDTTGVAPGGTKTYTFTAGSPGTYLYEAALLPNAEHQVAMGLYGALIVQPTPVGFTGITVTPVGGAARTDASATYSSGSNLVIDAVATAADVGAAVSGTGIPVGTTITAVKSAVSFTMSASAGAAYGATTAFNEEAALVLSELDPALNNSADPAAFDMRTYAPKYFLINGKAYPGTDPIASAAGHTVLLRYVNAGVKHHSMGVLGLRQNFIAKDGSTLPQLTHNVAAETLAPGQTGDAIATIPTPLTNDSKFAIYDASLSLHNGSAAGMGGMMTFVAATGTGAIAGPTASGVTLTPNKTNGSADVTLTALISSGALPTVTAAEYFVDTTTGAGGTGTPMDGTFGGATASVSATISVAGLTSGNRTYYVRGQDSAGTWGAFSSAVLNLDTTGPTSSALTLTPNPNNGLVAVALKATGNDSSTGGSNVDAAEYRISGGAGVAMTLAGALAPIRSLSATIPAQTATRSIEVRSHDDYGNWGAWAPITLTVVGTTGPVTSAVSASPNPNNGANALNSTLPVVRVKATMTSTAATIRRAEGFIDSTPAVTIRGFRLVPTDKQWNSAKEDGYADIPLSTINTLSEGTHTICVRGKDSAGHWGSWSTAGTDCTNLVIEKVAPTISGAALSATTVAFGAPLTLTVSAADSGSGLSGDGQYWYDGTAAAPANPIAFTGTSAALSPSGGVHTVYVRVRDIAGNWSTVFTVTPPLTVVRARANNYATTITNTFAGNSRTQVFNVTAAAGVLTNDQPAGATGRTAGPASPAVTRVAGGGVGTMTVAMNSNGGFSYTLNVPSSVTGNANIRAAKRGRYTFPYTETLNAVSSTATVTITVN